MDEYLRVIRLTGVAFLVTLAVSAAVSGIVAAIRKFTAGNGDAG